MDEFLDKMRDLKIKEICYKVKFLHSKNINYIYIKWVFEFLICNELRDLKAFSRFNFTTD